MPRGVSMGMSAGLGMKGAGEAYTARSEEEVARTAEAGVAGTRLHAAGLPTFAPTKRETNEMLLNRLAIAYNRIHREVDVRSAKLEDDINVSYRPNEALASVEDVGGIRRVIQRADL